ncbi:acyl-CoA desaturase [Propylenella binzhouense]|uniref:Acyl-CoA desaturase n=1 Tax=Propylenella binzhouense TaxID=2555902 RepID=A0A964WUC4_9HYPH|nr:acyl-CoA desaturase [Propylenella binzhouense]MYZ48888.1 acyl-CoA desaturase [Propylenella binzhouense]
MSIAVGDFEGRSVPSASPAPGVIVGGPEVLRKRIEYGTILVSLLLGSLVGVYWLTQNSLTWIEVTAFLIGYCVINVGVGMALHRYFTHKAFETNAVVRFILGMFGAFAVQGSIIDWVADHRRHHAHTDDCGDTHSPHVDEHCHDTSTWRGLLHAHFTWLFDDTTTDLNVYGKDLTQDRMLVFFHRTRWLWAILSVVVLPGLFGYAFGGVEHMWGAIWVGGFLRTFIFLNFVLAVNSIGHTFGSERFEQDNHSKNNLVLALLTFGDGWHNNHHRFPRNAFAGLAWWEIDVNGYLIVALEKLGLAWKVVRVPKAQLP